MSSQEQWGAVPVCRPWTIVPPNILFVLSDDHRPDALAAYGNPYIDTPHLDSLSAGFNFRKAHIMGAHHGAVCAPARAMLMSGSSLYHVYDNLRTVRTFPQRLRASGYVTFRKSTVASTKNRRGEAARIDDPVSLSPGKMIPYHFDDPTTGR